MSDVSNGRRMRLERLRVDPFYREAVLSDLDVLEAEAGNLRALFRRKMREWGYYGESDVDEFLLAAKREAVSGR